MKPLLWLNSGVMTRRDPSPPALSGEGSRSTSRVTLQLGRIRFHVRYLLFRR